MAAAQLLQLQSQHRDTCACPLPWGVRASPSTAAPWPRGCSQPGWSIPALLELQTPSNSVCCSCFESSTARTANCLLLLPCIQHCWNCKLHQCLSLCALHSALLELQAHQCLSLSAPCAEPWVRSQVPSGVCAVPTPVPCWPILAHLQWLCWGIWGAVPLQVCSVLAECPQGLSQHWFWGGCDSAVHLSILHLPPDSPGPSPVPSPDVSAAFWEPHLSPCHLRCPFLVSSD